MAYTSAEKMKLVTLLGWPAKVLDNTSTSYNSTIYARINSIDSDMEEIVTDYMERIQALDDKLETALNRTGVKRIDDIEFFGDDKGGSSELTTVRSERKKLIRELASVLDVAVGLGAKSSNMVDICV